MCIRDRFMSSFFFKILKTKIIGDNKNKIFVNIPYIKNINFVLFVFHKSSYKHLNLTKDPHDYLNLLFYLDQQHISYLS